MISLAKIKKRDNIWWLPEFPVLAQYHNRYIIEVTTGEYKRCTIQAKMVSLIACEFIDCEFIGCEFTGEFVHCTFINPTFTNCTFDISLMRSRFDIKDFAGHLRGINYAFINEYTGEVPASYNAHEQETIVKDMAPNSTAYRILANIKNGKPVKIKATKQRVVMTLHNGYPCHDGIIYHYSELSACK